MFNVNHFIVSQANPHAIIFSFSKSIWSNPVMGLFSGIVIFLKQELKDWFSNMFNLVRGQRATPMFDTKRLAFGSSLFMQDYEGRDIDVTINPWANHRSLFSAFLHLIYNPTDDELIDWVKAGERETWRHIPKIKSRVAVEMTLDKCVSDLRKQLIIENHRVGEESRIPSFAKLSGYSVADSQHLQEDAGSCPNSFAKTLTRKKKSRSAEELCTKGWGGLGLRGNYSSGSLNELGKEGLPFSDDERSIDSVEGSKQCHQIPGEDPGYAKTSNMANFYYRRSGACEENESTIIV